MKGASGRALFGAYFTTKGFFSRFFSFKSDWLIVKLKRFKVKVSNCRWFFWNLIFWFEPTIEAIGNFAKIIPFNVRKIWLIQNDQSKMTHMSSIYWRKMLTTKNFDSFKMTHRKWLVYESSMLMMKKLYKVKWLFVIVLLIHSTYR